MKLPVRYDRLTPTARRRVRELYIEAQRGLCCWCGAPLSGPPAPGEGAKGINRALFPRGFFRHPVHLQHSHRTGLTEGAVHALCNAVMWQHHGR